MNIHTTDFKHAFRKQFKACLSNSEAGKSSHYAKSHGPEKGRYVQVCTSEGSILQGGGVF